MDKLKAFYSDKQMMEAVYTHVTDYLKKHALIKVFSGEETAAIPEAKQILDGAFDELHEMFKEKKKITPKSPR
jgi:hypothetical protein